MNALEERLREALADRAAHSPIDPDAWDKTVARSRRRLRPRLRLPGWLPVGFVVPAAAAAAVVAVVLAAISLTGGTHDAASRSRSPATASPPLGTPAQVTDVLRAHPAVTAIVSSRLAGTKVYAWFSGVADHYGCFVVLGTSTSSGGSVCGRWPSGPSGQTAPVNYGSASRRAASVTARLNDGRSAPAVVLSGQGFPSTVWFASIPSGYRALLTFRDAAGHVVTQLTDTLQVGPGPGIPDSGGITIDGWTAYLTGGAVLWHGPDDGNIVGPLWTLKQRPTLVLFQETTKVNYALAYVPKAVTLLVLQFPNQTIYSGPTVPGWPGSGIRLWVHAGMPYGGLPPTAHVTGYNAANQIVIEQTIKSLLGG